jgi:hypothetical protein
MKTELSNELQALLMLLAFVLPEVTIWAGLGFPTDRTALGLMIGGVIGGVVAFIKELLGTKPNGDE